MSPGWAIGQVVSNHFASFYQSQLPLTTPSRPSFVLVYLHWHLYWHSLFFIGTSDHQSLGSCLPLDTHVLYFFPSLVGMKTV